MIITCPKCSAKYEIPSDIALTEGKKLQCSACQYVFNFQPERFQKTDKNKQTLTPPKDAVLSFVEKQEEIVISSKENSDQPKAVLPEAFLPVSQQPQKGESKSLWLLICCVVLICMILFGWFYRDLLMMDTVSSEQIFSLQRSAPVKKKAIKIQQPEKKELPPSLDIPLAVDLDEKTSGNLSFPTIIQEEKQAYEELSVQSVRFRKTTENAILIEGILKNLSSESIALPERVYAMAYGADGKLLFEKEIYLPAGVLAPGMEQAFFGTYTPMIGGVQWVDVVLTK